jgi:hypothetical protein
MKAKPSTYIRNSSKTKDKAFRRMIRVIDYYLSKTDVEWLETHLMAVNK